MEALFIAFSSFLVALQAGAGAGELAFDWSGVLLTTLAMMLNTGGVFFFVQLVNHWLPQLREKAPQWIPVIAMASGPLLNGLAVLLSAAVGHPIDFSPIIGALGGTAAVAVDQVRKQRRRGRLSDSELRRPFGARR